MAAAKARVDQAHLMVDKAKLALDRTVIRARATGRAGTGRPAREARHGARQGKRGRFQHGATLFHPERLQVRADVRLEDVPKCSLASVRIETPSAGKPLDGEVVSITSTDIAKNTLQVKVSIESPPATVKPEMLVQVTFCAARAKNRPEN